MREDDMAVTRTNPDVGTTSTTLTTDNEKITWFLKSNHSIEQMIADFHVERLGKNRCGKKSS